MPMTSGRAQHALLACLSLIVLAVVLIAELNRPDVTGADASLPYLVPSGTHGIAPGINRLTSWQKREMPIPRPTVIDEVVETRVAC